MRDDRSLLPQAIEEGLRWETPLLNFIREVSADTEFFGVHIPKGSTMMVNLGSANHDETRWEERSTSTSSGNASRTLGSVTVRTCAWECTWLGWRAPRSSTPCSTNCRGSGSTPTPHPLCDRHHVPVAAAARRDLGLRNSQMTRVIQWATGITGMMSLRHVIGRPDLDLVGVRVYDPAKPGSMPERSAG